MLTISHEDKTITKPITVLVNIFLPIVLADSEPPNIKIKPEATIIIPEIIGAIIKTRKFITLTNPTNKSQGLQSKPLQGTRPAADTEKANKKVAKRKISKKYFL